MSEDSVSDERMREEAHRLFGSQVSLRNHDWFKVLSVAVVSSSLIFTTAIAATGNGRLVVWSSVATVGLLLFAFPALESLGRRYGLADVNRGE